MRRFVLSAKRFHRILRRGTACRHGLQNSRRLPSARREESSMRRFFRSTSIGVLAAALAASVGVSLAQTPAQMEYERQQREYWRQQEQQRKEQQRQQQLMQENARRQQEESSRINAPQGQGSAGQSAGQGGAYGRAGDATQAADNLSAARARWEKQPALPPDKNPL